MENRTPSSGSRRLALWYGHHPLTGVLATVRWEAAVLTQALGTTVTSMLCVHGAHLPWAELMAEDIPMLVTGRVTTTPRALPLLLDEVQVVLLTELVRRQLQAAV
ncbi:MAG TPA: hypothetical protein VEK85_01650 [Gemmatimonadales bacterium]|nr:hypothetical protein [Gemmatimonadales bacterium]